MESEPRDILRVRAEGSYDRLRTEKKVRLEPSYAYFPLKCLTSPVSFDDCFYTVRRDHRRDVAQQGPFHDDLLSLLPRPGT